jgi:heterotetrameric sarcosine oxidase delta subunit
MLRIDCPWCGIRDEPEFSYGGESHIARPEADCSDEDWACYLFFRSNSKGNLAERWCHTHGCGQWFNVLRDTVTHEIVAAYRMGEPRPQTA